MGEISRFYGIAIMIYVRDHPPPHFHVRYNEFKAQVAIGSGRVIAGQLPVRVMRLVEEWRRLNKKALYGRWAEAESGLNPKWIDGLE